MYICIFEDEFYKKLMPLVHFKGVFDLKCGIYTLQEKIVHAYEGQKVVLYSRDYLKDAVKERHPQYIVNEVPTDADRVLLINGRILFEPSLLKKFEYGGSDVAYMSGDAVAAAWVSGKTLEALKKNIGQKVVTLDDFSEMKKEKVEAVLIKYPWELIKHNGAQLVADFNIITGGKPQILGKVYEGVHLLNASRYPYCRGSESKTRRSSRRRRRSDLHCEKCQGDAQCRDRRPSFHRREQRDQSCGKDLREHHDRRDLQSGR